ncbi:DUF805 domain-containing protein [Arthrobacter sp. 2RAF22]|uniref:DUF805 domain-containing protein n=1 Tax=Arthrobacter sp. 2RAF22 TaxID=3232996 RepID=UPI003F8D94FC
MAHANLAPQRIVPPLSAPLYGASPRAALRRYFNKWADFSGRAGRSEYWWVALLINSVTLSLDAAVNVFTHTTFTGTRVPEPPSIFALCVLVVLSVIMLVPTLALTARRLHDVNMRGWFIFLHLVPVLGSIAMLIITLLPPNPRGERFDFILQPRTAPEGTETW